MIALLVLCVHAIPSAAQKRKSPLQLADEYFAAGEYYTAANLYEQVLNPPKSQRSSNEFPLNVKRRRKAGTSTGTDSYSDIVFKQAESYRLAHYWAKAAAAYKLCGEKDPDNYINALYWYAVCERSLDHYDNAEQMLRQFLSSHGVAQDYKEASQKELQILNFIRQQISRPDTAMVKLKKINMPDGVENGVFAAAHLSGNKFLVSSTQVDSVKTKGENPYHSNLFYASLNNDNFEKVSSISVAADRSSVNWGAATVSADGSFLYFSQWKKVNGKNVSSIYFTKKKGSGWSEPVLVSSINSQGVNSQQPFCTADGKYLFFASDRPGGYGKFDIWYAALKPDGTTGEPVNAGSTINTDGEEQGPFYQASSNTLVFSTDARLGMGGFDLFFAHGSETSWSTPQNFGYPVNSSRDDIYFVAPERTPLLSNAVFSSDRGDGCCLQTYRVSRISKDKRLTGILRNCKANTPVADAVVILKDASGKISKAITGPDGKYFFDMSGIAGDPVLSVTRDNYENISTPVKVEKTDESDSQTDLLINAEICIEKKKLVIKPEDVAKIYFDFDKANLNAEAIRKLDSVYNVLIILPKATIQISGYTDSRGTDEYNKKLSERRAKACADYLLNKGIEPGRITFESFGAILAEMEKTTDGKDNPEARSRNRRALIHVNKE
jgi:OmpA-OmpF porin, OOP family